MNETKKTKEEVDSRIYTLKEHGTNIPRTVLLENGTTSLDDDPTLDWYKGK